MLILIRLCTSVNRDHSLSFPLWKPSTVPSGTQDVICKTGRASLLCIFVLHFCSMENWLSVRTVFPCYSLSCCFPFHTGPGGAGGACELLMTIADHSAVQLPKPPALKSLLSDCFMTLLVAVIYFLSLFKFL